MNHKETALRKYLEKKIGTRWHVQAHEDKYSSGIPDLSYGLDGHNGWIELKVVDSFPKYSRNLVNLDHLRIFQVNWLINRGKKAGSCFILVKTENTYSLFKWEKARKLKYGVSANEFFSCAAKTWESSIDPGEFCKALIDFK